jgi:hypothetical protein
MIQQKPSNLSTNTRGKIVYTTPSNGHVLDYRVLRSKQNVNAADPRK